MGLVGLDSEKVARKDNGQNGQKERPRRPTPLRFRFYLGGAVAVHLTASACLLYGLYQLQPVLFVLFAVGVGLEMGRVRSLHARTHARWRHAIVF
jgi:hypothetical protein